MVMATLWLTAMSVTTAFGQSTLVRGGVTTGQGHALVLVEEAQLRDLVSQIRRSVIYAKEAGLKVEKCEMALKTLNLILADAGAFLRRKKQAAGLEQQYETIVDRIRKGQELGQSVLRCLREELKGKYPWHGPGVHEADSNVKERGHTLKGGALRRYFYGTRIPAKTPPKEMDKILRSIKPFDFDFFSYGYKAKKVNQQKGKYNWKTLNARMTLLNAHEYPVSVPVNFGSMRPWALMDKFSWIPKQYARAEIEGMLYRNDKGEVVWRSGFHSALNIWHPVIIAYQKDWLAALGSFCRDRNIIMYELFNEMGLSAKKRPVGYSKYARIAFGDYLKKKYRDIEALNKIFKTAYTGFEVVKPPPADGYQRGDVPIGLLYEFERFRKDGLVDYMKQMIAELRRADTNPEHAVSSQFAGWFNDAHRAKYSARDFLRLGSLDWDLYGAHCAGDGRFPAITLLYHYCISRYAKKLYWNDEFWWDYREAADEKVDDEIVLRAVGERNVWRHIAYGARGINIFPGLYSDLPSGLLTKNKEMKYAAAAFPVVFNKINKYAKIFINSHILNQQIAILQPSTTLDVVGNEFLANENAMKLSGWMLSEHLIPFYVPEECIIDGREDLAEFKVLISPHAPFAPKSLLDRIDSWVKSGGIFLVIGPFGEYNQYGKEQKTFVKVPSGGGNAGKVLSWKHGKGKVTTVQGRLTREAYVNVIAPQLDEFREVKCDVKPDILQIRAGKGGYTGERDFYAKNDVDLVPWQDKKGNVYLFVINLNPVKVLEPMIGIKGRFDKVVDLCVQDGFPVPVTHEDGFTHFSTALVPGQGVIFAFD